MILTDEQTSAIKSFTEDDLNVSVQAVPGAGKSTLIIELIKVLKNKGAKCLVVAYNTDLASHMVKLLSRLLIEFGRAGQKIIWLSFMHI